METKSAIRDILDHIREFLSEIKEKKGSELHSEITLMVMDHMICFNSWAICKENKSYSKSNWETEGTIDQIINNAAFWIIRNKIIYILQTEEEFAVLEF